MSAHKPQCEVAFKWGWPTVDETQGLNTVWLRVVAIVIYTRLKINALFNTSLVIKLRAFWTFDYNKDK